MSDPLEQSVESPVEFVGPFHHHDVVVGGWSVPLLQAQPKPGGQVTLLLDRRFGIDLSVEDAQRFVPFLAEAIAVALGFNAHPSEREPKNLPPLRPRYMVGIDQAIEDGPA